MRRKPGHGRTYPPKPWATLLEVGGKIVVKPERADFKTDIDFMHALHAFHDMVRKEATEAFSVAFHEESRRLKLKQST